MTPMTFVLASAGLERFSSMVVTGLSIGAIYALLALGFVIIFKATQVVNFAHGALAAAGAALVASFAVGMNFPGRFMPGAPVWLTWALAVVCAVAVASLLGIGLERAFIRPMIGQPLFSVAVITLGIDIVVRTITNDWLGAEIKPLGNPFGTAVFQFGVVRIPHTQVLQIVVTLLVVMGLAVFFRSRTGIAMRATAFDQEAALAQGISVAKVFSTSWAIGAGLAALGGLFAATFPRASGVSTLTAFVAFRALPAVILGGLDSVVGAVVGGFAIGMAEAAAGTYVTGMGAGFPGIVPYLVMILVLLVRPYGLFGTEEIRRV